MINIQICTYVYILYNICKSTSTYLTLYPFELLLVLGRKVILIDRFTCYLDLYRINREKLSLDIRIQLRPLVPAVHSTSISFSCKRLGTQ